MPLFAHEDSLYCIKAPFDIWEQDKVRLWTHVNSQGNPQYLGVLKCPEACTNNYTQRYSVGTAIYLCHRNLRHTSLEYGLMVARTGREKYGISFRNNRARNFKQNCHHASIMTAVWVCTILLPIHTLYIVKQWIMVYPIEYACGLVILFHLD